MKPAVRAQRKVEIEPRTGEGFMRVATYDKDQGTIEIVVATQERVLRVDYSIHDGPFWEELSLEQSAMRLDRLNSGRLNLIDNHGYANGVSWGPERYQTKNVLGVSIKDSARVEGEAEALELICKARLSVAAEHADMRLNVAAGVISQCSVGYRVWKYEVQEMPLEGFPVMRAVDWEVTEISFTACPADSGSFVRAEDAKTVKKYTCVLVERAAQTQGAKPVVVKNNKPAKNSNGQRNNGDAGNPEVPAGQGEGGDGGGEGEGEGDGAGEGEGDGAGDGGGSETRNSPNTAVLERKRVLTIQSLCKKAKLDDAFATRLIDGGVSLDKARTQILNKWETAIDGDDGDGDDAGDGAADTTRGAPARPTPVARVREVSNEKDAIIAALMNRGVPDLMPMSKLTEHARSFVHFSLFDLACHFVERNHEKTRGVSKMHVITRAMTSSDFPNLLAATAHKTLRDQYDLIPISWKEFCKEGTLSDFKLTPLAQLSDAPALEEIPENGAVTTGKLGEHAEQRKLKSYGKLVAITRVAIINDDLGAFTRIPSQFALSAAVLIEDEVYKIFGTPPTMGDGVVLFHAATHGNKLTTSASALALAGLSGCRKALRSQKTVNNKYLNLPLAIVLVPTDLETTADQLNTQLMAAETTKVNPFSGKFKVICNPRLDGHTAGTTTWYGIVDKRFCDTIQVDFLQGESGPTIESEVGFEVAGVKIKCNIDVGVKAADWRGIVQNVGV